MGSINKAAEREGKEKQKERAEGGGEGQQIAEMILNKQLKNFRQTMKEGEIGRITVSPSLSSHIFVGDGLSCEKNQPPLFHDIFPEFRKLIWFF